MSLSVPCESVVTVTVTAEVAHRCPFVEEYDRGTVEITWTTGDGATVEAHALAALLAECVDERISHEDWTRHVYDAISGAVALDGLVVTSRWCTGALDFEVTAGGESA